MGLLIPINQPVWCIDEILMNLYFGSEERIPKILPRHEYTEAEKALFAAEQKEERILHYDDAGVGTNLFDEALLYRSGWVFTSVRWWSQRKRGKGLQQHVVQVTLCKSPGMLCAIGAQREAVQALVDKYGWHVRIWNKPQSRVGQIILTDPQRRHISRNVVLDQNSLRLESIRREYR